MLNKFFHPQSIAVLGASTTPGKVGYTLLQNLIRSGYQGNIFPINPHASEIFGIKAYPTLLAIDTTIDLLIYLLPPTYILSTLDECKEKNIQAVVVISAGFKETGPSGAKLEKAMLNKAKELNIRILGPNCLGLMNTTTPLNATFAQGMPSPGSIAFFSQSGALCIAVLDWALGEGIGFSKFISLGNKADLNEVDFLSFLATDTPSKVILGYLEGIDEGKTFFQVAREVTKKKPVIITKAGSTAAGAKAASSHTGSLAGSERSIQAVFRQSGIIRAETVSELFDYARIFSTQPLLKSANIAILTNSGGPGIMAADAIERHRLTLAPLSRETQEKLRSFLPPTASIYNPVDIIGDANADRYSYSFQLLLKDPGIDALLVILTPTAVIDAEDTAKKIASLSSESNKVVVTSFMGKVSIEKALAVLRHHQIPNYEYPEDAVKALRTMYDYCLWLTAPAPSYPTFKVKKKKVENIFSRAKKKKLSNLGDQEAREMLSAYGLKTPRSIVTLTSREARDAAEEIGYPVVMKISSPDILHKTDVGGVKVGLKNPREVEEAFFTITSQSRKYFPHATILGVLVQEMVQEGKEVIVGANRDPQFGPLLMFGLGGIYVEVLKDVSFRLAPISEEEADQMIREIRSFPLLRGVRGEPPADLIALRECLLRISQLVTEFKEILELDINPLIVKPEGKGAIALDARIIIEED